MTYVKAPKTITPEMFIAFAKERYGLNIVFKQSDDPDTFEKLFGINLEEE